METEQSNEYINVWDLIPKNAFLYFPEKQEIKVGSGEKQWRKIFQNNKPFDEFESDAIQKLEEKLIISNIKVHPWFDNANKLRYLQANKWKKNPTCQAIAEYSRYRYSQFPIKQTPGIIAMLNKGTFYLNGRDNLFRPIIMADLDKFSANDIEMIPPTLVFLMEFIINNLLIEGQVENYILIMNLESFSMDQKSLVSKILSFTSNSYRGRLFVSYLLGAPSLLRFGWNSLASAFVSENTLKKIKVTGDLYHDDMWTHIDKSMIQKKYGGTAQNITSNYWPPNAQKLLFQSPSSKIKLITIEQYNNKFMNLQLQKRKVLKSLLKRKTISVRSERKQTMPLVNENDALMRAFKILASIDQSKLTDVTVLVENTVFPSTLKSVNMFFKDEAFKRIM